MERLIPGATAPLAGITVIDLTRLLPGPLCTQYLTDLGAEVIKVEQPEGGDYARRAFDARPGEGETSAFFQTVNRGKQSVVLDLAVADQRDRLMDLVRNADVLVEGFRPGVAARLGFAYPEMSAINPGLVYLSLSGYGQTGHLAGVAGHDLNYLAYSGLLDLLRDREGEPVIPRFQIADVLGGALHAVAGILAGLVGRQHSGIGRYIDVAMTDCCKVLNIGPLTMPQNAASLLAGGFACYKLYGTSDCRHLAIGAVEPKFWLNLCTLLQRPDLVPLQFNLERQPWLRGELAAIFEQQTLAQWCDRFAEADCCFSPVLTAAEAMRGVISDRSGGGLKIGIPIRVSNHAPDLEANSPELGEHNSRYFRGEPAAPAATGGAGGTVRNGVAP